MGLDKLDDLIEHHGGTPDTASGTPKSPETLTDTLKEQLTFISQESERLGRGVRWVDIKHLFSGTEEEKRNAAKGFLDNQTKAGNLVEKNKQSYLSDKARALLQPAASPEVVTVSADAIRGKAQQHAQAQAQLAKDRQRFDLMKGRKNPALDDVIKQRLFAHELADRAYDVALGAPDVEQVDRLKAVQDYADSHMHEAEASQRAYDALKRDPDKKRVKGEVLSREMKGLVTVRVRINKFLQLPEIDDAAKAPLRDRLVKVDALLTEYGQKYDFLTPGKDDLKIESIASDYIKKYESAVKKLDKILKEYEAAVKNKAIDQFPDVADRISKADALCFSRSTAYKDFLINVEGLQEDAQKIITDAFASVLEFRKELMERGKELDLQAENVVVEANREKINKEVEKYPPLLDAFELAIDQYDDAVNSNDAAGLLKALGPDGRSGEMNAYWQKIAAIQDAIVAVCDKNIREEIFKIDKNWIKQADRRMELVQRLKQINKRQGTIDLAVNEVAQRQVAERMLTVRGFIAQFKDAYSAAKIPKRERVDVMANSFGKAVVIFKGLIDRKLAVAQDTKEVFEKLTAIPQGPALRSLLDQNPAKRQELTDMLKIAIDLFDRDLKDFFGVARAPQAFPPNPFPAESVDNSNGDQFRATFDFGAQPPRIVDTIAPGIALADSVSSIGTLDATIDSQKLTGLVAGLFTAFNALSSANSKEGFIPRTAFFVEDPAAPESPEQLARDAEEKARAEKVEKEGRIKEMRDALANIIVGVRSIMRQGVAVDQKAVDLLDNLRVAFDKDTLTAGKRLKPDDLKKLEDALLGIKRSSKEALEAHSTARGENELEGENFKNFFLKFDFKHNSVAPFELATPEEAQLRMERAKEAFELLQNAIVVFSKFVKDRIQQGLGRRPEAADLLSAHKGLEEMVIENPVFVNSMIEKMEMFIGPTGLDNFSPGVKIEENIARLENSIDSELSQAQLEQIAADLDAERSQLTAEYRSLEGSDVKHKEALFQAATGKRSFKDRFSSLIGLPSSLEVHIKSKYGLTLKQAAAQVDSAKSETAAFTDQLKGIVSGLKEVTEQYSRIRQRIVDLQSAQKEKNSLELQLAQLKANVMKNSRMFRRVANFVSGNVNRDILRSLSPDPTLEKFEDVSDKIRDLERASGDNDYMHVQKVGQEYVGAVGFRPGRDNVVEKLYVQLEKAVEKSVVVAADAMPQVETGVIKDLEKIAKAYSRGKAIINMVLERQIKAMSSKEPQKAVMLRAIQVRLNKKL